MPERTPATRRTQLPIERERDWQIAVIALARMNGWRVAHFRQAQTESRWMTPVGADGAGWPDLVMVRGDRIVYAELKGRRGRLSPAQRVWLDLLRGAGAEVYVWTAPADWPVVVATLERAR